MIFKLKDYSTSYRDVLKRKLAYSTKNRFLIVAETAAETGCHNLALLLFLEDLQGSSPDLSARIEEIKSFYLIDTIQRTCL